VKFHAPNHCLPHRSEHSEEAGKGPIGPRGKWVLRVTMNHRHLGARGLNVVCPPELRQMSNPQSQSVSNGFETVETWHSEVGPPSD
jgi:hypothetical protein